MSEWYGGVTYVTVATPSANRYFDLDAVRTEAVSAEHHAKYPQHNYANSGKKPDGDLRRLKKLSGLNPAGAPPLDWHIDLHDSPAIDLPQGEPVSSVRYLVGDVFERLAELPDGSVDCIVTSPPFLALRSYLPADHPDKHREIGSEPTPAAFLDTLLALTAEWRRVLAPHGSLCVELGDTFASHDASPGGANPAYGAQRHSERANGSAIGRRLGNGWPLAKSLCGIPTLYPWSLAYGRNLLTGAESPAGQWRIRNLIVWARPNPPVGALGDKFRPATSYITVACTGPKRWFDLDAVRTAYEGEPPARPQNPALAASPTKGNTMVAGKIMQSNPAGAPPLDWHADEHPEDGDWLWKLPTQPFSGWAETVRHVRVPADAHAYGSQRTTSPDCPVHGSKGHRDSNARDGAHAADSSNRNGRNGSRPAQALADGSLPTLWSSDPTDGNGDQADRAATPHSTPSSRTDHVPATTAPGTPSARTSDRTAGTSDEPESSAPHPGTLESSSESDDSLANPEQGTSDRTADTAPDDLSSCTCSFYVVKSITERTSHYATFPLELPRRLILAMCPPKVCRTCGKPSERIVEASADYKANRQAANDRHGSWTAEQGRFVAKTAGMALNERGTVVRENVTLGWTDCGHNDWRTGVVLDPFGGSGTTGEAAIAVGRDAILIDLDSRNADLARDRCGMFLNVESA